MTDAETPPGPDRDTLQDDWFQQPGRGNTRPAPPPVEPLDESEVDPLDRWFS